MEYVRPSFDHIVELVVADYEKLVASGWRQDVDLYVRRGGHFVIRLLQDCYAADGARVPARAIDSVRYSGVGKSSRKPVVRLPPGLDLSGRKVLVVDDVADEADTLIAIRDAVKTTAGDAEVRFMTLYKKPWARLVPDYWVEETDRWINFPWEPFEVLTAILARNLPEGEEEDEVRKAGFVRGDLERYARVLSSPNEEFRSRVRRIAERMA